MVWEVVSEETVRGHRSHRHALAWGGPSADSVEQRQYFLRWTRNHRSLVPYYDRPLHEHRVL